MKNIAEKPENNRKYAPQPGQTKTAMVKHDPINMIEKKKNILERLQGNSGPRHPLSEPRISLLTN